MKFIYSILLLCFLYTVSYSQLFSGPASGSVPSGIILNTGNFSKEAPINPPKQKAIHHKLPFDNSPIMMDFGNQKINSPIYQEDMNVGYKLLDTVPSLILKSFQGNTMTNSIPPDPYIAVGPQHIMTTVNSNFAIWDKSGNLIKQINADSWYATLIPGVGSFDPKILYDHFAKRWIMVWLDQDNTAQRGFYIVSVSDDSIPTGVWYNWAISSNLNGTTTSGTWGDYQGVGFDSLAVYITSNQFAFGGSFQYVKIRIIPKTDLYANTGGQLNWMDLWNINYPTPPGGKPFNIRPTISYTHTNDYYLLNAPSGGGNFLALYKLSNPTTNPSLSVQLISASYMYTPPNANQLGGGSPLIDGANNCSFRFEPTFKNGKIWAVNNVQNPNYSAYSAIRYFKIDVISGVANEDIIFGANGYWMYYTGLAVDKQDNVAINFSRSSNNEYAGAHFITKPVGFTTFSNSNMVAAGRGNYVVTYGGTRNRWGDYNGLWLDPVNRTSFWMLTEFAAGTNTWGTWINEVKVALEAGATIYTSTPSLNYQPCEINFYGDTLSATIQNFGDQNLVLNSINFQTNNFAFVDNPTFPKTLLPYENVTYKIVFTPKSLGTFKDTLQFNSNAISSQKVVLTGKGYVINQVLPNLMYASSGLGKTYKINLTNASVDSVGIANYNEIKSIAVNPKTKIAYGLINNLTSATIVRMNGTNGDAYKLFDFTVENPASITFDTSGTMLLANRSGLIFQVNVTNKTVTLLDTCLVNLNCIAINPKTNELWGGIFKAVGLNKDQIVKINPLTGDTVVVGNTTTNALTTDLEFDQSGNLYGLVGGTSQATSLIKIDTTNATAVTIGSSGVTYLTSLAYSYKLVDVKDNLAGSVPSEYYLKQNYPNPFNPSTTIEFGIPTGANIQLLVYDMLGQVVKEVFHGFKTAGNYRYSWNAEDNFGNKLPSGIYFYELRAKANDNLFTQMKKMILLK